MNATVKRLGSLPLSHSAWLAKQQARRKQQCASCKQPWAWLADSDHKVPQDLDGIVVLGGGLDKSKPSGLPEWGQRRCDTAADVLSLQGNSDCQVLCSGGGTPHRPPTITERGMCLFEGMAYSQYLMQRGVPVHKLLKETSSYDTLGNAYFSAVIHAWPLQWSRVGVVTSAFHMPRTQLAFQTVFRLLDMQAGSRTELAFVAVSDEGTLPDNVLEARRVKEFASTQRFVEDMQDVHTLADFSRFMHETHLCYSVARQHELGHEGEALPPQLLASY